MLLTIIVTVIAALVSFLVSRKNLAYVKNQKFLRGDLTTNVKKSDAVIYAAANGGVAFCMLQAIATGNPITLKTALVVLTASLLISLLSIVYTISNNK